MLAVVAQHASVQLHDIFASGLLVQAVNVLGNNTLAFSSLLQLCQLDVRNVGFRIQTEHFIAVKPVKFLRLTAVEAMA